MINIETEFGPLSVDFDPTAYKTPAGAAKALHKALHPVCKAFGQNPDIELMLFDPDKSEEYIGSRAWRVCWEAGPYEWAYTASDEVHGDKWVTEPYYSFDLLFYED